MKKTLKSWIFFILSIIFILIVPCGFVWLQYGDLTSAYKISVTAVLLIIGIVLVFKRLILNKYLKTLDAKIINIESNALSITDSESIKANKTVWRGCCIIKLLIDCVIPICLGVLAVITIKVVEQGLIKLYGCLIFCLISIGLGIICRIVEICTTKLKHEV